MKKNKKWLVALLVLVVLLVGLTIIVMQMAKIERGNMIKAMYVPYGQDGSYVMIDVENGTVFTVHMPEKIYNENQEQIKAADLKKGNILEIWGNGIMFESYPGQYPGVTEIHVIEAGNPNDAMQYQEIIDSLDFAPDPAEIPALSVGYCTDEAVVTGAVANGGYNWSYADENGKARQVSADAAHVLMWEKDLLGQQNIGKTTELTLVFTSEPREVKVSRWEAQYGGSQEYLDRNPEGEAVPVEEREKEVDFSTNPQKEWVIPGGEPGYIYRVTAVWDNGTAEYGFSTR